MTTNNNKLTIGMPKKNSNNNCKFKPGDKIRIVAGKYIGRFGEYRRDTDSGDCMGCVVLIGDACERKLWKTSMKLVTDQCARKEIALLAMHLSGLTIEEVMRAAQWR